MRRVGPSGMATLLTLLLAAVGAVDAYDNYALGDKVPVYVNKVGPYENPHETYHYYSLPLCRPDKIVHHSLSLGQVLDGDRMADSSFDIRFQQATPWKTLCGNQSLPAHEVERLVEAVEEDYYAELIIDDLKVHHFIGFVEEAAVFPHEHRVFLYTHYIFEIEFNGFNVIDVQLKMNKTATLELFHDREAAVNLAYSVEWKKTNTEVGHRPAAGPSTFFATARSARIHWLSILNSLLLVALLVGVVAMIVFSSVRRDLSRYNQLGDEDELILENGWKTIAGDVFRPPKNPMILSAILGAGAQLLTLAASVLAIGTTQLVNVHNHGLLNSLCVVLYALTSSVAGYVAAHKYQSLGGTRWIATINLTSLVFVVPVAAAWALNNSIAWAHNSTQALPWTTVLLVVCIWMIIGYPLTVLGGVMGRAMRMRKPGSTAPFRTRAIPRELPTQTTTRSTPVQAIIGGMLPFCAISVELSYIFSTIWGRESYTLFYVVFIIFAILIVVTACTAIALTYFQLNGEDYHWWWRSLLIGGSVSVYIFLYGVFFLHRSSSMNGFLQLTEFFTHLSLLCYAAFLACGTIAHVASARFVEYIYSSVKSD